MKEFLYNVDRKIFHSFYTYGIKLLEGEILDDCESLLDIGCGSHSPISKFSKRINYSVGIDAFEPAINESKQQKIHDEYYLMDWKKITEKFQEKSFDCVCALDFIEHLPKEEGYQLIEIMERMAKKKVIISTPNGFLPQGIYYNNLLQVHRSGWDVDEMRRRGYHVIGIEGYKHLKGEVGKIRWRPRIFWSKIALWSQPIIKNRPHSAFAILCIKNMK